MDRRGQHSIRPRCRRKPKIDPSAQHLATHLKRLKKLRGEGAADVPRVDEVKRWQSRRLERTYADLAAQPRYRAATAFFLEEVYGEKDFSARDEEMLRVVPVMSRILPASAVQTAALAVELEALTEDLDRRGGRKLAPGAIDEAGYAARLQRASAPREERGHQVELVRELGERLDVLVRKPFVGQALKLMGKPARLAGLGDLQDFLERGFAAFRELRGARDFLDAFRDLREPAAPRERIYSRP